jgi:hypothetical protein
MALHALAAAISRLSDAEDQSDERADLGVK